MKDPRDLNCLYFVDALIYAITFDAVSQTATVTLEADAAFHEGVMQLLPENRGADVLVDVVMSGVRSVRIDHIPQRNASWAADEKPHDWEIAKWQVRAVPFRSNRFVLKARCQLGQEIRVAFEGVTFHASCRQIAVVHNYG